MSSTTNPHRRNYRPRRRKKIKTRNDKKIASIAKRVIEEHEKDVVEVKYHDLQLANTGFGAAGTMYSPTSTIPQGTTSKQRVGKDIVVKSFFMRYLLRYSDSTNVFRVIIFRWFKSGTPAPSDLLQDPTAQPWISPIKMDNGEFTKVLYDNIITLDQTNHEQFVDKIFIKRNMNVNWDESSLVDKGHIFILLLSDSGIVPHPSCQFYTRVRFTDQ